MRPGVVGAAHQGAGFDVAEAEGQGPLPERSEFLGRHVTLDRELVGGGLEVLTKGQDVAADATQVAENVGQLVRGLAQAEH